jgi:hypothetical protein
MIKNKILLLVAACLLTFSASFAQKSIHPNSTQKQRTNSTAVDNAAGTTSARQAAVRARIDEVHKKLEQFYKANRKDFSPAQIAYIDSIKTIIDARMRSLSQSDIDALH